LGPEKRGLKDAKKMLKLNSIHTSRSWIAPGQTPGEPAKSETPVHANKSPEGGSGVKGWTFKSYHVLEGTQKRGQKKVGARGESTREVMLMKGNTGHIQPLAGKVPTSREKSHGGGRGSQKKVSKKRKNLKPGTQGMGGRGTKSYTRGQRGKKSQRGEKREKPKAER